MTFGTPVVGMKEHGHRPRTAPRTPYSGLLVPAVP